MENLESIPIIKYDSFLKSKYITWKVVGGRIEDYPEYHFGDSFISYSENMDRLIFSFRFYNNRTFLVIKLVPKEYKLRANESISFLFENEIIIHFTILTEPYKSGKYLCDNFYDYSSIEKGFGDYYETLIPIKLKEIEIFSNYNLINWSINFKNHKIIGGDKWKSKQHREGIDDDKLKFQTAIKMFASEFIKVINNEIPKYNEYFENEVNELCYVYLMHDTVNNFYKIGISNSPEYRERTLQSEKPSIIMVCYKSFPKRKIAEALEKVLHEVYSSKRVRGEWFSLNEEDIKDVSYILKN